MTQCLHLDQKGRRCGRPAEEESGLCRWHEGESAFELAGPGPALRKLVLRVAALLLLAIFLLPLAVQGYRWLKNWLN